MPKSSDKPKKLTQDQIIAQFNQLRQEQRTLIIKLTELEQDVNEHNLVLETLKDVDPERVCYRMVGGVLVERKVKDVIPAVAHNKEQLMSLVATFNQQIEKKGNELNEFKEKFNIQIRKDLPPMPEPTKEDSHETSSVLVNPSS